MSARFRIIERAPMAYYAQVRSPWLPWVWDDISPYGTLIERWDNGGDDTYDMAGKRIERFLAMKGFPRIATQEGGTGQ